MQKKVIIYVGLFVGCFLCGLLLAFGWQKFFARTHEGPQQVAPATAASKPAPKVTREPLQRVIPLSVPTTTKSAAVPVQPMQPEASPQPVQPAQTAQHVDAGSDIILLIDCSGSMKKTDPANYRQEASKLIIALLGPTDRVGVISFGDAATVLSPLTQNTEQNRTVLFNAAARIASRDLTTNITDAVQKGFDALTTSKRRDRVLLMMSDGKIDLGSRGKDAAALGALNALLPELATAKIRLYTVAFTEESDSALLERMALETGGSFRFTKTDRDVHSMFASIFEKIKSPDAVPFQGESFQIDRDIREATVLVTKKQGTALALMDPANAQHSASRHPANIAWFESSVFDMITIQTPTTGTWSVKPGGAAGNKVYVLTDLSLKTSFDKSFVTRGEQITIDAWFEKKGGIVTEKDVLESIAFSVELAGPDGTSVKHALVSVSTLSQSRDSAGRYSTTLQVVPAGDYSAKLLAQGSTFKREKTFQFKAVEPAGMPVTAPKQAPLPAIPQESAGETVNWAAVLARFAIVNAIIAALAGGGYLIRKKFIQKRKAP